RGMEFEGRATMPWEVSKDVPVIALNGWSKKYACTGFRMGYVAFHNDAQDLKNGILGLCRMRLSANHPFQWAVLETYRQRARAESYRKDMMARLKQRRDFAFKRASEIPGISLVKPAAAFYAFPKVENGRWRSDKEFVYKLLEETGVLTVFGSGFSSLLEHLHFRFVFLPPLEELEAAFDGLERFMRKS
ncbi:MAG: aminotransferase class I/II-fold pyridoxal phosphate-dependent enzyme, partial [Candidatus Micrarchaeia archaeon]